jgi:hypothetical protein
MLDEWEAVLHGGADELRSVRQARRT